MNEQQALNAFSVLSNETRLRMLKRIVKAGGEGMIAGEIAKHVGAAPSRASFHLAAMTEARLLTSTRKSRQIVYAVNFEEMGRLLQYLMEDCCQSNEVVMACCSQ
jgi:ArsR family transcriptional regulator